MSRRACLPCLLLLVACGGLRSTPLAGSDGGEQAADSGPADSGPDEDAGATDAGATDAGTCTAGSVPEERLADLGKIRDLAFDSEGRLYVLAQLPSVRVRVLGPAPTFEPVAELGAGVLTASTDFDLGASGQLRVLDALGATKRVVSFQLDGGVQGAWDAGRSAQSIAELHDGGLLLGTDQGALYQADAEGGGLSALVLPRYTLSVSMDLRRAPDGTLWHADFGYHRLLRVNPSTSQVVTQFGSKGSGPGQFDGMESLVASPSRLAVDEQGRVYADDFYNHRVQWFSSSGAYGGELPVSATAYPWALATEPGTGRLFIGYASVIEIRCRP